MNFLKRILHRDRGNKSIDERRQHREPYVRNLQEAYETGWMNCPCIFVLSTGRAGTKTLSALLNLSPEVTAKHEPLPRMLKASFDAYTVGRSEDASGKWSKVILTARDDFIVEANMNGKIYIETSNRLTYFAPVLAETFPCSRFIHLHRHPYEVIRSGMRRRWYQDNKEDFTRIRPRLDDDIISGRNSLSPLELVSWYWSRINLDIQEFLALLPAHRKFQLRADDLFTGDREALTKLFKFVGADIPDGEKITRLLNQKLNKQGKGLYPKADAWSLLEREVVNDFVRDVANVLGYQL